MFVLRLVVLGLLAAYGIGMGSIPSNELNGFGKLVAFSAFLTVPAFYMLPTIEAKLRDHTNVASIALVNLFLGWTLLGWVAALVWAFKKPEAQPIVESRPYQPMFQKKDTKICPYCAEEVMAAAIKCKHCGSELVVS